MRLGSLTLGTAQLSSGYGVANRVGQRNEEDALEFLHHAYRNGILTVDTAPAYAGSERVIGEFNSTVDEKINVITKLPSFDQKIAGLSQKEVTDQVLKACRLSKKSLRTDEIDCYLIHDEKDFTEGESKLIFALKVLLENQEVGRLGISVYSARAAHHALDTGDFGAIQVPCNVFDRRFDEVISRASKSDTLVFARSIYLQGLFFLSEAEVKKRVPAATPYVTILQRIADELSRPIDEVAMAFIRDIPGIDSMVIGMESVEQVDRNMEILRCAPLTTDQRQSIMDVLTNIPAEVVNPSLWNS